MVVTVAIGLLGIALVVIILHAIDHAERRRMEADDRRFRALLERAGTPEPAPDAGQAPQNSPDMRDWSRRPGNGPEIAKSEGVSHGSRGH